MLRVIKTVGQVAALLPGLLVLGAIAGAYFGYTKENWREFEDAVVMGIVSLVLVFVLLLPTFGALNWLPSFVASIRQRAPEPTAFNLVAVAFRWLLPVGCVMALVASQWRWNDLVPLIPTLAAGALTVWGLWFARRLIASSRRSSHQTNGPNRPSVAEPAGPSR